MHFLLVLAMMITGAPVTAQINDALLAKKITITSSTTRMDSLLKIFSRQTGAGFSFNSGRISPAQKLAVPKHVQTLAQWLQTLQKQLSITHTITGNHVILFDNRKPAPASPQVSQAAGRKMVSKRPAVVQVVIDTAVGAVVDTVAAETRSPASVAATASANAALPATRSVSFGSVVPPPAVTDTAAPSGAVTSSTTATTSRNTTSTGTPVQRTTARSASATQPASKTAGTQSASPASNRSTTTPATSSKTRRAARDTDASSARTTSDDNDDMPQEYMQFFIGYAKHGSGDYQGMSFGGDYTRYLSERFSLSADLRGSINSGKDAIYSTPRPGETKDNSVRFTTAGAQLGLNAQYSFVRSTHHEVMISLGAFGRYQSASNGSDGYSTYEPIVTGLPSPVVEYDNRTPQNTFAVGGLLQLHYHFTLNNNMLLGLRGGLQTDSNGDLLVQAGISVGKRF